MTEKELIINILKQIADTLANTFPQNCEVVVHDLEDLSASLIYILGNVTNRKLGAPITDMVVMALHEEGQEIRDKYNYTTYKKNDGRQLKSSTTFVRNSKKEVVAALCINIDTTEYLNAIRAIEALTKTVDSDQHSIPSETFAYSVDDTIDALVAQCVSEVGKELPTMSREEKIQFVEALENRGAFQIKGVVNHVAERLNISEYTVYNYLKKIRAAKAIRSGRAVSP